MAASLGSPDGIGPNSQKIGGAPRLFLALKALQGCHSARIQSPKSVPTKDQYESCEGFNTESSAVNTPWRPFCPPSTKRMIWKLLFEDSASDPIGNSSLVRTTTSASFRHLCPKLLTVDSEPSGARQGQRECWLVYNRTGCGIASTSFSVMDQPELPRISVW